MQLINACKNILAQLANAVEQIGENDFIKPSVSLSHASLGAHVRHTLEFFICLQGGFRDGVVNYDKRAHDKLIETDKQIALLTIAGISRFIEDHAKDKKLFLQVAYEASEERVVTIETNYFRELTYNIEHAVHHMAIMKIGIREVAPYTKLSPDFGVAVSTVRYMESNQVASS